MVNKIRAEIGKIQGQTAETLKVLELYQKYVSAFEDLLTEYYYEYGATAAVERVKDLGFTAQEAIEDLGFDKEVVEAEYEIDLLLEAPTDNLPKIAHLIMERDKFLSDSAIIEAVERVGEGEDEKYAGGLWDMSAEMIASAIDNADNFEYFNEVQELIYKALNERYYNIVDENRSEQ